MKWKAAVRTLPYALTILWPAFLIGCATLNKSENAQRLTAEEYVVFGAVVWEVFAGPYQNVEGPRRDTIPTGTYVLTSREAGLAAIMDSMLIKAADIDPTMVRAYLEANRSEFRLEPRIPNLEKQVTLSRQEVDSIFAEGRWDAFYRRYPDAVGLVGLSRVGFSDDGQSALVFVSRYHGGRNGELGILHLRRGANGWSVVGWPVGKIISE